MLRQTIAVTLATMAASTPAQIPIHGFTHVGAVVRQQVGNLQEQQRVSAFAMPADTLRDHGLGRRIRRGGRLYLYGAGLANLPQPTQLPPGTARHYFSVCLPDANAAQLPYSTPGHDLIFNSPALLYEAQGALDMSTYGKWDYSVHAVAPPQGWQAHFLLLRIPNDPLLVGMLIAVQSVRFDGTLYASHEVLVEIG